MSITKPRFAAVGLALAGLFGCSDSMEPGQFPDDDPGFVTTLGEEFAVLDVEGEYPWWQNSVHEDDYASWATQFDSEEWRALDVHAEVQLMQNHQRSLWGSMTLDGTHDIEFSTMALGWGWRAVFPEHGSVQDIDLESLRMAPNQDQAPPTGFGKCQLADTRIMAAFSKYPGTMEELWAEALLSAEEQGLDAPRSWYAVVRDPIMYEYLFGAHGTLDLRVTTFAFLSLQLDPSCGELRLSYRSEKELAGPVQRVEE